MKDESSPPQNRWWAFGAGFGVAAVSIVLLIPFFIQPDFNPAPSCEGITGGLHYDQRMRGTYKAVKTASWLHQHGWHNVTLHLLSSWSGGYHPDDLMYQVTGDCP